MVEIAFGRQAAADGTTDGDGWGRSVMSVSFLSIVYRLGVFCVVNKGWHVVVWETQKPRLAIVEKMTF